MTDDEIRIKRPATTGMIDEPMPQALPDTMHMMPGVYQRIVLNWPRTYTRDQVRSMCEFQKSQNDQTAITSKCLTCGASGHTRAVSDFENDSTIPDFTIGDGWYAICQCGVTDTWTIPQIMKNL